MCSDPRSFKDVPSWRALKFPVPFHHAGLFSSFGLLIITLPLVVGTFIVGVHYPPKRPLIRMRCTKIPAVLYSFGLSMFAGTRAFWMHGEIRIQLALCVPRFLFWAIVIRLLQVFRLSSQRLHGLPVISGKHLPRANNTV
jgi:hypothetical protein